MKNILSRYIDTSSDVSHLEIFLSTSGALLAIAILCFTTSLIVNDLNLPIIVASMGASAVLLFAAPTSQMAQPWPLLGGHCTCALIGVSCQSIFSDPLVASTFAVPAAIVVMYYTRCLHPPGGATALLAILGGESIRELGFQYVLTPIALNAFVLLILAIVINKYFLKRTYPITYKSVKTSKQHTPKAAFETEDLHSALRDMDTFVDISEKELQSIFSRTLKHAHHRKIHRTQCSDIMNTNIYTVEFGDELENIWLELHQQRIRSAPVVDRAKHVIGIITITDFLMHANIQSESGSTFTGNIRNFIKRTDGHSSNKPEVAGQIMTTNVQCVYEQQNVSEILPIFTENEYHQIPVINNQDKLVGLIGRSDLVSVLA